MTAVLSVWTKTTWLAPPKRAPWPVAALAGPARTVTAASAAAARTAAEPIRPGYFMRSPPQVWGLPSVDSAPPRSRIARTSQIRSAARTDRKAATVAGLPGSPASRWTAIAPLTWYGAGESTTTAPAVPGGRVTANPGHRWRPGHRHKSAGGRHANAVAGIRAECDTTESAQHADRRDSSRIARRRDGLDSREAEPAGARRVRAGRGGRRRQDPVGDRGGQIGHGTRFHHVAGGGVPRGGRHSVRAIRAVPARGRAFPRRPARAIAPDQR